MSALPYFGRTCPTCDVLDRLSYVDATTGWCAYCGLPGQPTALYRFFDAADVLLYVGVSKSAIGRMLQHADSKPWWREVTRSTIVWYPNRKAALKAERLAIGNERPRYNVVYRAALNP